MRLKQLQKKLETVKAEFKAWLDGVMTAADKENRGFTEEEQAKQAEFQARVDNLESLIAAEQTLAGLEPTPDSVIDAGPIDGPHIEVGAANIQRDPFRGFREGSGEEARFAMGEFALAVRAACRAGGHLDQRLVDGGLMPTGGVRAAPTNYHQETGTPEGAMVPPVVSQAIWEIVFDDPLLALLTIEPTGGNVVEILGDETTPWGATGIVAKWRSEGTKMEPSKLDTKMKQVRLQELYAFVLSTEELLEDAPRLADRLNRKAPEAIRWKLMEAFMWGTGAGQPLGWAQANYAGKVSVSRKTASQINPDDPVKMFARLLVQGGPDRSFWATNRDTLPDLILRSIVGNVPVWMPPSGLAGAPNGTILGRPVFFSEHCETLGTAGDLQLVNPDGYYATQRGPARQDSSIHLYFDYAITAFRWMFRFAGQPLLSAAVSAAKGSSSKSHFVVLS